MSDQNTNQIEEVTLDDVLRGDKSFSDFLEYLFSKGDDNAVKEADNLRKNISQTVREFFGVDESSTDPKVLEKIAEFDQNLKNVGKIVKLRKENSSLQEDINNKKAHGVDLETGLEVHNKAVEGLSTSSSDDEIIAKATSLANDPNLDGNNPLVKDCVDYVDIQAKINETKKVEDRLKQINAINKSNFKTLHLGLDEIKKQFKEIHKSRAADPNYDVKTKFDTDILPKLKDIDSKLGLGDGTTATALFGGNDDNENFNKFKTYLENKVTGTSTDDFADKLKKNLKRKIQAQNKQIISNLYTNIDSNLNIDKEIKKQINALKIESDNNRDIQAALDDSLKKTNQSLINLDADLTNAKNTIVNKVKPHLQVEEKRNQLKANLEKNAELSPDGDNYIKNMAILKAVENGIPLDKAREAAPKIKTGKLIGSKENMMLSKARKVMDENQKKIQKCNRDMKVIEDKLIIDGKGYKKTLNNIEKDFDGQKQRLDVKNANKLAGNILDFTSRFSKTVSKHKNDKLKLGEEVLKLKSDFIKEEGFNDLSPEGKEAFNRLIDTHIMKPMDLYYKSAKDKKTCRENSKKAFEQISSIVEKKVIKKVDKKVTLGFSELKGEKDVATELNELYEQRKARSAQLTNRLDRARENLKNELSTKKITDNFKKQAGIDNNIDRSKQNTSVNEQGAVEIKKSTFKDRLKNTIQQYADGKNIDRTNKQLEKQQKKSESKSKSKGSGGFYRG